MSAPSNLAEGSTEGRRGPLPGEGRAGPGRGRTLERTAPDPNPIVQPPPLPPLGASEANWLLQLSLQKKWQTARITQLEEQVATLARLNMTMARYVALHLYPPDVASTAHTPPRTDRHACVLHIF